jgi:hypothetical protein
MMSRGRRQQEKYTETKTEGNRMGWQRNKVQGNKTDEKEQVMVTSPSPGCLGSIPDRTRHWTVGANGTGDVEHGC